MKNSTDNRKPAPRIVGWIGVALSIAVMVMCVLILTGCLYEWADKDCAPHGGVAKVRMLGNTGIWKAKCNDGTVFFK